MRGLACVVLVLAACAPDDGDVSSVELDNPRALLACAAPPPDLEARLWISGSAKPCALDVDVEAGKTSGTCDAKPGIERTLTIDWFVTVAHGGDDLDLVLAQARGKLDLSEPEEKASFTVKDDDVKTDACLDMRRDTLNGKEIVTIDGKDVPPCDVDESCTIGGDTTGKCTNLGEVCAGTDPFDSTAEPP